MIDFQNASYVKLSQVDYGHVADQINPLLTKSEQAFVAYKGMRDYVVFTSKRIIAVNVQGITGKEKGLHLATTGQSPGIFGRDRGHVRLGRRA